MARRHKIKSKIDRPPSKWKKSSWYFPLALAASVFILQLFFAATSWSGPTLRDSARAMATTFVSRLAEAISETSLAFMEGEPGSPAQRVSPTDPNALHFTFGGENHQAYLIHFPDSLQVSLGGNTDNADDPDRAVRIYDVVSSEQSIGTLPGDGSMARVSLGGTRDRLRMTQQGGEYSGEMPLTIVYP